MTTKQEEQLSALRIKRIELERHCTDPDVWEDLAAEYAAIGAVFNAWSCARRGKAYRNVSTEAQGEIPMRNAG